MIINLWITKQCNLTCKYCYEKQQFNKYNEVDKIDDIILWMKKNINDIEKVIFHGGEPLLKFSYIKQIVSELVAIKSNIMFGITTNGTIWNNNIRDFFIEYKDNFSSDITVSIDGDKETHDLNRICNGKGTFKKVLRTSENLLRIDGNIRARMTFTPDTIHKLNENIVYLYKIGFRTISSSFDFTDYRWSEVYIEDVLKEYIKIYNYWNDMVDVNIGIVDEINFNNKLNKCNCEFNLCLDGIIYPCTFIVGNNNFKIGDINRGIDYKIKNEITDISFKTNEKCRDCSNKDYCDSNRCKLMNYSTSGNYYEPNQNICAFESVKNLVRKMVINNLCI